MSTTILCDDTIVHLILLLLRVGVCEHDAGSLSSIYLPFPHFFVKHPTVTQYICPPSPQSIVYSVRTVGSIVFLGSRVVLVVGAVPPYFGFGLERELCVNCVHPPTHKKNWEEKKRWSINLLKYILVESMNMYNVCDIVWIC